MKSDSKIIFIFGPGGVGKTTVSSALGLGLADAGYDTLVVTVDPAKRLKDVLKIGEIGFEPVNLNDFFKKETQRDLKGRLDAMMVDSKNAFLNLLKRYITDEWIINKVTSNRIFEFLSESLIGAQEYFAAEKIYDIFLSGKYDCIVVDTAPSKNAFEFIDGASKMAGFLDKRVIRFFIDIDDSESIKGFFFKKTGDFLYRILGIIFGDEFIIEMKEFLNNISVMYDELLKRAYELSALYLSDSLRYFIVGSPQKLSYGELNHLKKGLIQRGIREVGIIINRAPYFYGREWLFDEMSMLMTKCKNDDIRANLGIIIDYEREMLEQLKRDLEGQSEILKREQKAILPDLYMDISSFKDLLRLGEILKGGVKL